MNDLKRNETGGTPGKSFRLAKSNAKIWGVCGGIADHFDIDATMVRIGFVAGTLLGFGTLLLVYLAIALVAD